MKKLNQIIRNIINRITGADALLIRIQTLDTLVASQRNQIRELEIQVGDCITQDKAEELISKEIENVDFVTTCCLNDAIEDALNDQDWDSIVSDALTERRSSDTIYEIVEEEIKIKNSDTESLVIEPLIENLEHEWSPELIEAIATAVNKFNKSPAAS